MSGLEVSIDERVARIVFDRPGALNALSPRTLSALIDICADLERNDAIRVALATGAGSSFSAGADLPAILLSRVVPAARLGARMRTPCFRR